MNPVRTLLLGTALAAAALPALAHGDEDHSEPNPVVAAVPMAAQGPRAEAQTDRSPVAHRDAHADDFGGLLRYH